MTQKTRNIVQAEFYLAGLDAPSLEEAMSALAERGSDGQRSKLVVRFFDGFSQPMTRLVRRFERLKKADQIDFQKLAKARERESRSIGKRSQQRVSKMIRIKLACLHKARDLLRTAIAGGDGVAIQTYEFAFRLLQPHESHETLESAMRGQSLDVFVFETNPDLISDGIKILYSDALFN